MCIRPAAGYPIVVYYERDAVYTVLYFVISIEPNCDTLRFLSDVRLTLTYLRRFIALYSSYITSDYREDLLYSWHFFSRVNTTVFNIRVIRPEERYALSGAAGTRLTNIS